MFSHQRPRFILFLYISPRTVYTAHVFLVGYIKGVGHTCAIGPVAVCCGVICVFVRPMFSVKVYFYYGLAFPHCLDPFTTDNTLAIDMSYVLSIQGMQIKLATLSFIYHVNNLCHKKHMPLIQDTSVVVEVHHSDQRDWQVKDTIRTTW